MEKSAEINEISKALIEFQSKTKPLDLNKTVKVKTKTGGEYSFKYATFAAGIEMIQPILKECKLAYSQVIEADTSVTTILMHETGQFLSGNLLLKTSETTAQAIGSMITYAKRYSLFSMLGVVADDDDDGNSASGNNIQQQTDKKQVKKEIPADLKVKALQTAVDLIKSQKTLDAVQNIWSLHKHFQQEKPFIDAKELMKVALKLEEDNQKV